MRIGMAVRGVNAVAEPKSAGRTKSAGIGTPLQMLPILSPRRQVPRQALQRAERSDHRLPGPHLLFRSAIRRLGRQGAARREKPHHRGRLSDRRGRRGGARPRPRGRARQRSPCLRGLHEATLLVQAGGGESGWSSIRPGRPKLCRLELWPSRQTFDSTDQKVNPGTVWTKSRSPCVPRRAVGIGWPLSMQTQWQPLAATRKTDTLAAIGNFLGVAAER